MPLPSGVNDGWLSQRCGSFAPKYVSPDPSGLTIAIEQPDLRSASKTIRRPSGDQSGSLASPSTLTICRSPLPSAWAPYNAEPAGNSLAYTNAPDGAVAARVAAACLAPPSLPPQPVAAIAASSV